jgi:pSer/pThr/pTyr-binding forkhead associated (FHA) protein
MPTCARGHESQSVDYCDECGAPIGAAPLASGSVSAASGAVSAASGALAAASSANAASSPSTGAPAAAPDGGTGPTPCPDCGTPASGRFCESCGFDLLMARLAPDVAATPSDPAAMSAAPDSGAMPENSAANSSAGEASAESAPAAGAPVSWRLIMSADAAYYARMQDEAEPDAEPISFPAFCPERRFALDGDQILIGRRSRSRGIEPQIDLSGPPEDPAVSHAHALLVPQPAGGWAVVDLDSANGTYVNDGSDPIRANEPVSLGDGDHIHLGAWTTLTLRRT